MSLGRLREQAAQIAALQRAHPLFSFVPNKPSQEEFFHSQDNKITLMTGGNRGGKTAAVVVKGICNTIGFHPFMAPDDPDYRVMKPDGTPMPVPNIGQVAAEDYPNGIHRVQWPAWLKWLPKGSYEIAKQERGIVRELRIDVSGLPWADRTSPLYPYSRVHFFAYEQGREPFAGFEADWILNDEPMPRAIWVEQMRGLVASGGPWMGAATIVDLGQAWLYDVFDSKNDRQPWEKEDLDEKQIKEVTQGLRKKIIHLEMRHNLKKPDGSGALTESDVREYEEMLTPEEREVRVRGGKVHLLGTEWGRYFSSERHVLPEHREPDPALPQIMAVDPHPTMPYAMLWVEVNEDDEFYVWAEAFDWRLDTIHAIAQHIKKTEGWKAEPTRRGFAAEIEPGYRGRSSGLEPNIRLMDPLGKTNERGLGKDVFQQLAEESLFFQPWRRANKDTRVRNVRDFLKPGYGPDAHPRLSISPTCRELLYEIPRYRERMPQDPEMQERKGDMMKVRDHLVDCLIAICNSGYTYGSLMSMKPREQIHKPFRRPVGRSKWRALDARGIQ